MPLGQSYTQLRASPQLERPPSPKIACRRSVRSQRPVRWALIRRARLRIGPSSRRPGWGRRPGAAPAFPGTLGSRRTPDDPEGAVGLAIDAAGDLDAFERPGLGYEFAAEVQAAFTRIGAVPDAWSLLSACSESPGIWPPTWAPSSTGKTRNGLRRTSDGWSGRQAWSTSSRCPKRPASAPTSRPRSSRSTVWIGLPGEVFGPILHGIRFDAHELYRVPESISAT